MKKRVVSFFVCLSLLLALAPVLSPPASAATKGHTQSEAVAWTKKQVGEYRDWYKDKYYAQCVELVKHYYSYLGYKNYGEGNATEYQRNALPPGWKRVKTDPKPGDVIVWGAHTQGGPGWKVSKYGHVGIVVAVKGSKLTTVEQNIYGSPCRTLTRTASYATCFIRPDFTPERNLTIRYHVNGGTVSAAGYSASGSGIIQKNGKDSVSTWASGSGNAKYGLANATTPGLTRDGFVFVGWSLSKDGSSAIFDQNDTTLIAEDICPDVKNGSTSVTLYAVWIPAEYNLNCYYNESGKNYLLNSDFSNEIDSEWWLSRDESVSTISIDASEPHNDYNSLKIVNTTAGSSAKDLGIRTLTQGNQANNGYVGETKKMTLSFWAKSSKDGTQIFFRWGYESGNYRPVTLSTDWEKYTVQMDRTPQVNQWIHPYIDAAGTVWLSELQLEDGPEATDFVPETVGLYTSVPQQSQSNYALPAIPGRYGYTFDGWYTAVDGGEQITDSTRVQNGHMNVYAHWIEGHTHTYASETTDPTCTEDGFTIYTCETCGDTYTGDVISALGHNFEDDMCTRCGMILPSSAVSGSANSLSALLTADKKAVELSSDFPDNVMILAVRYRSDDRMETVLLGKYDTDEQAVSFSPELEPGWTLFFLDPQTHAPLCSKSILS